MHYRQEIDGLRAVAVVPVILFHAGFAAFAGGFVGVDVFFVISGYLITSILVHELREGDFRIRRFYARRARRILPALFLVMLACIPFAWAWMLPGQFKDFSQALVAVNLFASNVLFWRDSGYFTTGAENNPLLHTWSLAVEEQYYLFFPLVLLLLWRFGRSPVVFGLALLAALSLVLSQIGLATDPQGAFYLIPTRAWELLAGSLCALLLHHRPVRGNDLLATAGLGLIVWSVFAYNEATPFPGVHALAPVVGTALVILFAARETLVARLLSFKGFVAIGLVSYSAYLWHQPLFVFARLRSLTTPGPWLMLGLTAVSLGLAYLTWRFVEQPFRRPETSPRANRLFYGGCVLCAGGLVSFGLLGHVKDGFEDRIGPQANRFLAAASDMSPIYRSCMYGVDNGEAFPELPDPGCIFPPEGTPVGRALILGDSHASAIGWPLIEGLRKVGYEVTQVATAGCAPFRGFFYAGRACDEAAARIDRFMAENPFDVTIVATRPHFLFNRTPFDNAHGSVDQAAFRTVYFDHEALGLEEDAPLTEKASAVYRQGIYRIAQNSHNVVLVGPIPEAGWNVPVQLARRTIFSGKAPGALTTPLWRYVERNEVLNELLRDTTTTRIRTVWPADVLCDTTVPRACLNSLGERVFYSDNTHPTNAGAALIAPLVLSAVADLSASRSVVGKPTDFVNP